MYPKYLDPAYSEVFQLENKTVEIPKCILQFQHWSGARLKESFGGKPIVSLGNQPMFAELAIMTHFINSGWQARWVETYGRGNQLPVFLSEWKDEPYANQKHEPIEDKWVLDTMSGIAKLNKNSYAGCWDVLAWKDKTIIFAESKRNNKDYIRPSQNKWLATGLAFGLKPDKFLLVQWDYNPMHLV